MRVPCGRNVTLSIDGADATVLVWGDIDVTHAASMERCVLKAFAAPNVVRVSIGLYGCTLLSSAGLRSLVRAAHLSERTGRVLTITGAQGVVRRAIEISGLDEMLPVAD